MVEMTIAPGVAVTSAGAPISGVAISTEAPEGEQKFSLGTLSWYVIVRDGRVGVRLKDSASPALSGFRGVPAFAPDVRWRIPARFEAKASTREVPTATGQSGTMKVAGLLVFDFNGQEIRLEAYDDGGKDLFVMFKDKTSGRTTYPAGRYLYVPRPDAEGRTVVDFNRAYNPPCAFTPFATCPFPPRTNHLNFAVEAGEKTYH